MVCIKRSQTITEVQKSNYLVFLSQNCACEMVWELGNEMAVASLGNIGFIQFVSGELGTHTQFDYSQTESHYLPEASLQLRILLS